MQSMSEDDTAYAALLTELFSDSTPDRGACVHSWIQQQYGSVVSERERFDCDSLYRPPSPSPSSSIGAHHTYTTVDSECSFHDSLFFPPPDQNCEEQICALRSIVQQMALHISRASSQSPHCREDKPLPTTQYTSSPLNCSHASLTHVSCLPSVRLSSERVAQEIPSYCPLPLVDGYVHERCEPFLCSNISQDNSLSCHVQDYRDYVPRSQTGSNYSFANSRKTSSTTLSKSPPVSPTDAIFLASPRCRENIVLSTLSVDDQAFLLEPNANPACEHVTQSSPLSKPALPHPSPFTISLPTNNEPPASQISCSFPAPNGAAVGDASLSPCTLKFAEHSQSRWSVTTTATGSQPENVESSSTSLANSGATSKKTNSKLLATSPKRNRFMNIMSRFSRSPGATETTKVTTSQKRDDSACDPANDGEAKENNKKKKMTLSGKSSLASIRTSLSLSRASIGSLRSPVSSPTEEVPPLPRTPTRTPSFALPLVVSPPKTFTRKIPIGKNLTNPPSIQSITPSITSHDPTSSVPASRIYLSRTSTTSNESRSSLLSPPLKQLSPPSAKCVDTMGSTILVPTDRDATRSKLIVQSTERSTEQTNRIERSSVLSVAGIQSPPPPKTVHSTTPSTITSAAIGFTVPAKLATAMATQSPRAPASSRSGQSSPQSTLKVSPSSRLHEPASGRCFPCLSPISSPSGLVLKHDTRNGVWETKS